MVNGGLRGANPAVVIPGRAKREPGILGYPDAHI